MIATGIRALLDDLDVTPRELGLALLAAPIYLAGLVAVLLLIVAVAP